MVIQIKGCDAYGNTVMEEWNETPTHIGAFFVEVYRTWAHRLVHWGVKFRQFPTEFEALMYAAGQGRRCKYLGYGCLIGVNHHGSGSDADYFIELTKGVD